MEFLHARIIANLTLPAEQSAHPTHHGPSARQIARPVAPGVAPVATRQSIERDKTFPSAECASASENDGGDRRSLRSSRATVGSSGPRAACAAASRESAAIRSDGGRRRGKTELGFQERGTGHAEQGRTLREERGRGRPASAKARRDELDQESPTRRAARRQATGCVRLSGRRAYDADDCPTED